MRNVSGGTLLGLVRYNNLASGSGEAMRALALVLAILLLPLARFSHQPQRYIAYLCIACSITYIANYLMNALGAIMYSIPYAAILVSNVLLHTLDSLSYLISLAIIAASDFSHHLHLDDSTAELARAIVLPRVTREGRVMEGLNGWRRKRRLPRGWVVDARKACWEERKERRERGRMKGEFRERFLLFGSLTPLFVLPFYPALLALSPSFATEYRTTRPRCELRGDPEPVKNGSPGKVEVKSTTRDGFAFKVRSLLSTRTTPRLTFPVGRSSSTFTPAQPSARSSPPFSSRPAYTPSTSASSSPSSLSSDSK